MFLEDKFKYIPNLIGFRKDWNQSNGGHISFQKEGKIYIKPSGKHIHKIENEKDLFIENIDVFEELLSQAEIIRDNNDELDQRMSKSMSKYSSSVYRPSIETVLHTQLNRYTLHIHPLNATALSCHKNWKDKFKKYLSTECLFLEYSHPGLELGLLLSDLYKSSFIHYMYFLIFLFIFFRFK